ncbi:hypothetical protein SUGI_0786360 [Cryptomeria japonica]|uniref:RING-H2 finger protein ATL2 n=1 Tax=Cryptomeria japonica TaxID=3369 RepID=UPI0024149908|nr:RING-H2 finger protein ATL2 [Cryptomeria japonica]GLJ38568.1 hypothetical protein SUGI_0786360 [Cryptomeria japonica]
MSEKNKSDDGGQSLIHLQGWHTFIIMVGGASLCFLMSILIIFYYVYLRFYSNTQRQSRSRSSGIPWAEQHYFFTPATEGLCKQALDALPVFVYNPENFKDGLRCAVCLCEFEEEETGRLLPNCNHSFHLECIDMWFSSHSTCPICRAAVEKESGEVMQSPPVSTVQFGISVTAAAAAAEEEEEEENLNGAGDPEKGNVNQHGTDEESNIVTEIGINIHDIPSNGK